jgi:NDMA-dependent alcohol dehydrogenase
MRIRGAIMRGPGTPGKHNKWEVVDLELDEPKAGEVLVEMKAAGLCHSDQHVATGDNVVDVYPNLAGHEGAGIVRKVGEGVLGLEVGDHVLTAFVPACGRCRFCARGQQNLCDRGAILLQGPEMDGTYRLHTTDGAPVSKYARLGTFSDWQVYHQDSLIKIDKDIPFEVGCLVSCGVQTGFGSAITVGGIRNGDVVVIVGTGGVGMNAVQGAREAGAAHVMAVDLQESKRKWALDFGATESYSTTDEAWPRISELTNGQGADVIVLCPSLLKNTIIGDAFSKIRKGGKVVVVSQSSRDDDSPMTGFSANAAAMQQKTIAGGIFGGESPRDAMPNLLNLYRAGRLKIDELITKTYSLDEINEAVEDMYAGKNIRGVIKFGD